MPKPGTDAAAPAPRTEIGLHSTVAERIIGMLEDAPDTPAGWRDTGAVPRPVTKRRSNFR